MNPASVANEYFLHATSMLLARDIIPIFGMILGAQTVPYMDFMEMRRRCGVTSGDLLDVRAFSIRYI